MAVEDFEPSRDSMSKHLILHPTFSRSHVQYVDSEVTVTRDRRSHLEIGFKVWENRQGWLWLIDSPHSNGGTIGAAATEDQAIHDARSLIENLDTRAMSARSSKPAGCPVLAVRPSSWKVKNERSQIPGYRR
jgi:hypothetical protein